MNRAPTGRFVAAIILGLVLGGILGEGLGFLFGWFGEMAGAGWDNNLRNLAVSGFNLDLGYSDPAGVKLDLNMLKFRFGFGFKFNLMSVLGMGLALYVEKWSRSK